MHTGFGVAALAAGGASETTTHAFEKSIFVLDGALDFLRDGHAYRLVAGDFALISTGVAHAWRNSGAAQARWVMVESPQPKQSGEWQDTWFSGPTSWPEAIAAPDLADPRTSGFGHYAVEQQPPAAEVSSQLHGFSMRMLLDGNSCAVHFYMFIINFPDGGLCNHHDHPFEETYFMLEGEVDCTFEGEEYTLKAGDYGWTGVGAQHGFFPRKGQPARWLEVQVPQPPRSGWQRWYSLWDYIEATLKD